MNAIEFPEGAAENEITQISTTRFFKKVGGAWVVFRNNIPNESPATYPFQKPIEAATAPPLPNNNPFWQNSTDGKLYMQKTVAGNTTWTAVAPDQATVDLLPIYSATAPALPNTKPFWQNTTDGKLYYQSFNGSTTSWVVVSPDQAVVDLRPLYATTAPALPNTNPFWQNTVDGKLYYQKYNGSTWAWAAVFEQVLQVTVVSQATAPALPSDVPFWQDSDNGQLYYQKKVGAGAAAWTPVSNFDRYDILVNTTNGAIDANTTQVIKVDNTTASAKTVTVSNAPAGRAMTFVIKVTGKAGTIAYGNTVTWSGGTAPVLGTTQTLVVLFWDGSSFIGGVTHTA